MRRVVLCVLLGLVVAASGGSDAVNATSRRRLDGVPLYQVADVCDNEGETTSSPICPLTPEDTSVPVSQRPPSSQYNPSGWDIRTRCCWGADYYSAQCESEYSGTSTCYPSSQTWAEAEATCTGDGRRLCTVAELSKCCLSGCMGDVRTVWTSMACGTYYYSPPPPSPSPPPPPSPPPHPPVCEYRIATGYISEEVCPPDERITTEGACEAFDAALREAGGQALYGVDGLTLYSFMTSEGTDNLIGGCQIWIGSSGTRVWYEHDLADQTANTNTAYKAVCGGCSPPSPPPPPPSPSPPPPPPPSPSPPPPSPATPPPQTCVTTNTPGTATSSVAIAASARASSTRAASRATATLTSRWSTWEASTS